MKSITGLTFCLLLGISIAGQGWTALFWVPIGFAFGLYATAQIILPIILGLPRAIALVVKGQMRSAVFGAIILTPVIWLVSLAAAGFFWPAAADYLYNNVALNLSANLGMIAIILSPLSRKCRSDFRQDFDKAYRRFYRKDGHAEMEEEERSNRNSQQQMTHPAGTKEAIRGEGDEAKESLRNEDLDAPDANTFIASGVAKAKSGNYIGAIQDFDKAIRLDPTAPQAYLERSKAKRELNDERGAAQDLNTFKLMFERLEEGLKANDAAVAAYDSDDYDNKAISLLPSLASAYYHRGIARLCLGDHQGAVEDFNTSIETNASNKAYAYHQRGKIKGHKLNDAKGAMQDFNEAIALCPNEADFFFSRAKISEDYDAIKDLNRAIELDQNNAEAVFYRALKRHDMEDIEGTIQDLTHFIELEPTDTTSSISEAYSLRGSMKQDLCDYNGALHDHDQAIEHDPSRAGAYFDRGVNKHLLGDFEGAIGDLTQAIALAPSHALAYQFRGLARAALGLQSEAETDFNDARSHGYSEDDQPQDTETVNRRGVMFRDGDGVEQDYVAAAQCFRRAAEQGYSESQHNLGLMYENGQGVPQEYPEAAKWYRMAAEQGNAGSQNNLGRLCENGDGVTQDNTAAIEWYRKGADNGDANAASNLSRLTRRNELTKYNEIVSAFAAARIFIHRANTTKYSGSRFMLAVVPYAGKPKVVLDHTELKLFVRENSTKHYRAKVLDEWYTRQAKRTNSGFDPSMGKTDWR